MLWTSSVPRAPMKTSCVYAPQLRESPATSAEWRWCFPSGEEFQFAPGAVQIPSRTPSGRRSSPGLSAWALEAPQTAVVPDVLLDDRTRLHANGVHFARSLVVVPVGQPTPFAAITFAWAQEYWPFRIRSADARDARARHRPCAQAAARALETYEHDEPGSVGTWLGSAADAEGLRGPERRHWLAVAELQHRVRNVLAPRALARPPHGRDQRASATTLADHLEGRIGALARIHGLGGCAARRRWTSKS